MEKMLNYFHKIRRKYPDLQDDIRGILADCRNPQDGKTISEIREAYKQRTESPFPMGCGPIGITEFILTIPFISVYCNQNGTLYFYSIGH